MALTGPVSEHVGSKHVVMVVVVVVPSHRKNLQKQTYITYRWEGGGCVGTCRDAMAKLNISRNIEKTYK